MSRPASKATPLQGEFKLPFEGKLSTQNRWVILAELIPWSKFEGEYAELFSAEMGAPAKSLTNGIGGINHQRETRNQ